MIQASISTGSEQFDKFLGGGYEHGIITTIYGPSASGKTTLCLLAAISMAKGDKKVIYIDTEGGFSITRLKQLGGESIIEKIFVLSPTTFSEQYKCIRQLHDLMSEQVGMIIIDTIGMHYRLALSQSDSKKEINDDLSNQIAFLTRIARTFNIPVILTNQVYSDFDIKDSVRMVGGDILLYGSKCLIELNKKPNHRIAKLKKHRHIKEGKSFVFNIEEKGIIKSELSD